MAGTEAVLFIKWEEPFQQFIFIAMHLNNGVMFYAVLFLPIELEVILLKGVLRAN